MMNMHANVVDTPPMPQMPARPDTDADLVARLQRGDESAFEAIVRAHSGRLLSVARRFLGNNEDAQDAVQDAFIRAFKAIHTFEARAQLHTWLHRILVNTALMKLRERRRRPTESIDDLLPSYSADGHQTVASRDWSDAVLERKETAGIVRAGDREAARPVSRGAGAARHRGEGHRGGRRDSRYHVERRQSAAAPRAPGAAHTARPGIPRARRDQPRRAAIRFSTGPEAGLSQKPKPVRISR